MLDLNSMWNIIKRSTDKGVKQAINEKRASIQMQMNMHYIEFNAILKHFATPWHPYSICEKPKGYNLHIFNSNLCLGNDYIIKDNNAYLILEKLKNKYEECERLIRELS